MSSKPHERTSESPRTRSPHRLHRSLAWPKTAMWPAVANHNEVRRVQLGAPETTRNTWPDIVSQVPVHRIGSPYYTRGHPPTPRSFGNFSACWAHSFGGLPETPVIRRDNMSGLKNWAVLGSGHFRYRKLSPPVTSEGRFHPFLTHFLRGEPDSIF